MPLFRALAKNMAASYFGESALRFCNGSYTSVCLYSVFRHRSNKKNPRFCGRETLISIYNALVRPHFDYCSEVYGIPWALVFQLDFKNFRIELQG